jgi:sec-independent protein translocase protein TatC
MAFPDEPKGAETPQGETVHEASVEPSVTPSTTQSNPAHEENLSYGEGWSTSGVSASEHAAPVNTAVDTLPVVEQHVAERTAQHAVTTGGAGAPPKPPDPPGEDGNEEEDGMSRMSFLEHLEELRKRLLMAIGGVGVAFFLCLFFSDELWAVVFAPAGTALKHLGVVPATLKLINPMDSFQIMWMKLPILAAVFIASPWVLYQVWAFIAPGLYKRERRWAIPFVVSSAGLFILGGFFAYFVAFRYGLEFLLGLGIGKGVDPSINITEYYDLFVDVMLGVGIIFEIPVLLFLLTLIKVASPSFLVRHSRYAILVIVILAAVITPTGDVFNLALFATPMIILFYIGIFASYILVLSREKRKFPWATFFKWFGISLIVVLVLIWAVARYYGYHFVANWPIFVR